MGRSGSSCLKIITCGSAGAGESAADENLSSESKASSDKRRWSFRKKSDRHRVLSNSVISEPVSVSCSKDCPEATTNNFLSPKKISVPDKAPIEQIPNSPAVVGSLVHLSVADGNKAAGHNIEDSVATVIQATIRGYLARRELLKLSSVVKLQAVVRGHLVRRQAIGTLRCIRAIIKMQKLVRARCSQRHAKDDEKLASGAARSTLLGNEASNKENKIPKKQLPNRFARQLLESTPKTKQIHIKCDRGKSDSTWKWLERWTATTSLNEGQQQDQNFESTKLAAYKTPIQVPVAAVSLSSNTVLAPSESSVPTEGEGISVTRNSADLVFETALSVPDDSLGSLEKNDHDPSHLENEALGMTLEHGGSIELVHEKPSVSFPDRVPLQSSTISPILNAISDKAELDSYSSKHATKRVSSEQLENEGKRLLLGSRKSCNPAFAAVQLKFEELSSNVDRSVIPVHNEALHGSESDTHCPLVDSAANSKDINLMANSVAHVSKVQIAASECGTEISISSTLDSPDRSEAEGGEIVLEIGPKEKGNPVFNRDVDSALNLTNMNNGPKNSLMDYKVLHPQRVEEFGNIMTSSISATDALLMEHHQPEVTTSAVQVQFEDSVDPHVYRSSPEGTPRSRTTAPESYGTPSSQVSVNAKQGKKDNMPIQKKRTKLGGKRSPSNPNHDSGGRTSTDNSLKESKTGNRRSSSGVVKTDHFDHEPRISSSNSLPSYMQATKSARAKSHAISPKSSPDLHDKDPKKRHSLPIGSKNKQGSSPRMQRSASQAQQSLKGDDTQSPNNSADRRWQR